MRRLLLFLKSLSLVARLQTLAVLLILAWYAWLDYQRGVWPVTIGILVTAAILARLLKPVMVAHPVGTTRIWSTLGVAFLLTFMLAQRQWWFRLQITHYACEFLIWLDLLCGYWFISEMHLRNQRAQEEALANCDSDQDFSDDDSSDEGDMESREHHDDDDRISSFGRRT